MFLRRLAACFGVLVMLGLAVPGARSQTLGTAENAAIDQRIHDYLLSHPEVLLEALQKAEAGADAQQAKDTKSALRANQAALVADPAAPVLGNPKGDVTLVEFFDYRCPYCKLSAPVVEALIQADPNVRVVMKEFPILGPTSVFAAEVALVADRHGRYAAFHSAMFKLKAGFDDATTLGVAQSVGLDPALVKREMTTPAIATALRRNLELARILGIDGTPAFIAGDTLVPGAVDLGDLQHLVAAARAKG